MIEVVQIPPAYSEDDAKRRDYLLRRLKEIDVRAREQAEHVLTELAYIENCYAPRYIITGAETRAQRPDPGTDTTDNGLHGPAAT